MQLCQYVYTLFSPVTDLSGDRVNPLYIFRKNHLLLLYRSYYRTVHTYSKAQFVFVFYLIILILHLHSNALCLFTSIATDGRPFHILTHSIFFISQKHKNTKEKKGTKISNLTFFPHIYSALCACVCWFFCHFFCFVFVLFKCFSPHSH